MKSKVISSFSNELKSEFMMKRSQNKRTFTRESYKSRWFVLNSEYLHYCEGTHEKRGKEKGRIPLHMIRVIECVEDLYLDNKPNVFQIVYLEDDFHTLYIVANNKCQRDEWIRLLRELCLKKNIQFFQKYHKGCWTKSLGKYNCCDQIARNAPGCELSFTEIHHETRSLPNLPVPQHPPSANPNTPREANIFVALYDYQPAEETDLALYTGQEYEILDDSREYWWRARDKFNNVGYIPSNYVKKKFDLEIYDWYYKDISRQHCEELLHQEGREGCFMVRDSSTKGMYTISIFTGEGRVAVRHYHIKLKVDGLFYLADKHTFTTIADLIHYHKHNSGGLATRLRFPPSTNRRNQPTTAGFGHDKWEIDRSDLTIGDQVGAGCFGSVHQAWWKGKEVAVKMMKPGTMSEDNFIEEAKTMTQLSHINLVQLYGIVTKSKPLIIITEYMYHGSLFNYLKRHRLRLLKKIDTLLDFCVQVCKGMAYLEDRKFIHRDLASRNCLVGRSNTIKVGDFGLARYVIDDEYTSSTGTKFPIKWASPEVLSYTKFSSKSDVWAFGILMWEIFTACEVPYEGLRNIDVVDFVVHDKNSLSKPPYCPDNIFSIMKSCWMWYPEERPSFCNLVSKLTMLVESGQYAT